MLWSTDKVRAEPSQEQAYTKRFNKKKNYNSKTVDDLTIALVPILWREKKQYKEVTENSHASSKNLKSESKK